jgi:hypothetical protein
MNGPNRYAIFVNADKQLWAQHVATRVIGSIPRRQPAVYLPTTDHLVPILHYGGQDRLWRLKEYG